MRLKFILLIVCLTLTACSTKTPTDTTTREGDRTTPSETEEPTLSSSEKTDVSQYEVISSRSIRTADDFEITLVRPRLENDPVKGWFFDFGFCYSGLSKAEIPESREGDADPPFILSLQFFRGDDETPLEMEVIGTANSYGKMDGISQICENQLYQFPADVVAGEAEYIIAVVTFHEMFGIAEPMRYEMDVVPLQGPSG